MRFRALVFLILWSVTACSAPALQVTAPPLALTAMAGVDPEQQTATFRLISNLPLTDATLLYSAEGGRSPIRIPLELDAQHATYALSVPNSGLPLAPDVDALRYSWTARAVSGAQATATGAITSALFLRDTSVPLLQWKTSQVGNVTLNYLPQTPGERDLDQMREAVTNGMGRASQSLNAAPGRSVALYLIPRVFWQGGVTYGNNIVMITYADRGYTGVSPVDYLAHEFAHALTQDWGNFGVIGGMLTEGIAVYATGGHYQPDLLDQSAATLSQSSLYIAPSILRRDFSNLQHEIAYTESGSFVKYLVDHYGIDKVRAYFRRPNDWQGAFGKDFDALAADWLAYLKTQPVSPLELHRWQLKVRFYNVLRQYEERLDPDGRRLPSIPVERWDGTLRSAMRKPAEGEYNQILELLLVSSVTNIETASEESRLTLASSYLDEVERRLAEPSASDSALIADVRAIVRVAQADSIAMLDRNASELLTSVDATDYPQFANQFTREMESQPAWLAFRLAPTELTMDGNNAFLTVARWGEPLDLSTAGLHNGERWVLAMHRVAGQWKVTGRWPATPEVPMAR